MEAIKLNGVLYRHTVREAAVQCEKDPSHIRRICIEQGIGRMFVGQLRLLSDSDLKRLKKYFEENGRKSKNSA